ncbi:MAG TPA: threonine/serine dehydratase [Stellaceae bacterium]|jgi:threonine dehydratase|nr:threonine/serine dehydratase [Stellaceae bacterium]
MLPPTLPDVGDVRAAAARLHGHAVVTPLLSSPQIDAQLGARVLIKAECLQRTGSFKFRGAYNALAQLAPAARRAGVVAYSSGNHAQGVAAAAAQLDMPATIVMPADAPAIKRANTRFYGAEIVPYDRYRESREAIAERIAHERGAALLPPYDDARVIAGQGTVGLEIAEQAQHRDLAIDILIAPCSGGGLVTGCALGIAAAAHRPAAVYAAEPVGLDDLRRSLEAGERRANDPAARSICDALLAPMPGDINFALARQWLSGSVAVTDDEVRRAMAAAFSAYKLVLEPSGAAALAAVLSGKLAIAGKTVAVVASGGNVDAAAFAAAIV